LIEILKKKNGFENNFVLFYATANSQQPTANSQQPTANSQQPTTNYLPPTTSASATIAGAD
jgi:hypothetical protein